MEGPALGKRALEEVLVRAVAAPSGLSRTRNGTLAVVVIGVRLWPRGRDNGLSWHLSLCGACYDRGGTCGGQEEARAIAQERPFSDVG